MSLVEVLAALAVFVIGILVIVRMFPPGFFVVKQSENVTLANRLAQAELERLKGMTVNLPAGILGLDPATGSVLTGLDPDDMDPLTVPSVVAADQYYYSDVNKSRHIYSESTKIPAPMKSPLYSTTNNPQVSIYILNFSPVDGTAPNSIIVRSGPMRRRNIPEQGRPIRSSSEYAIDYKNAKLYLRPAGYPREYVLSYSYWVSGGGRPVMMSVLSAIVTVPANHPDPVDILLPGGGPVSGVSGFGGIDYGSESVHRSFRHVASNNVDNFTPGEPYEFVILDGTQGVIAFNPAGYGYEETTAWGRVPLTAYIDYDVLDWHIIREERKLPEPDQIRSPADLDVKLTLRFIKNAGLSDVANPGYPQTVEIDGNKYVGLHARMPYSILAIDAQTGEWFNEESKLAGGSSEWAMTVNYKDGIIRFHQSLAGRTFRIYYRAEGDWALQVYKSHEAYRQSGLDNLGTGSLLDYREWWADSVNASDGVPYYNSVIHFPKCYSGMNVALDYTYRIKHGNKYYYYNVDGDTYTTDKSLGFTDTCAIDPITRIAQLRQVDVSNVEIISISRVYGVSVGTRVIWREGSRAFNAGQWRKVNLQTYLMRLQD